MFLLLTNLGQLCALGCVCMTCGFGLESAADDMANTARLLKQGKQLGFLLCTAIGIYAGGSDRTNNSRSRKYLGWAEVLSTISGWIEEERDRADRAIMVKRAMRRANRSSFEP